jgi:hypothetical protein
MAVYTTFFLCKPADLQSGFPGWRLPLAEPVPREFRSRFTGELRVVETREPEWPEDGSEGMMRRYQVVRIEGSYEDYLERRLPPFVQSSPHWATKGLTVVELEPLLEIAGVPALMEQPLYGPPSLGAFVQDLPEEFLAKLPSIDQENVAQQWAAVMSRPEYTHSVSGRKLCDGWTPSEALEILRQLVDLSKKASAGQQMYLLTEV